MSEVNSVCVFCGASNNVSQHFLDAGREFGKMLAEKKLRMVYGGGDCGMMGAVANGCLENGGEVVGVFPRVLTGLEVEHKGLTEIIMVDNMHLRKMKMFELSDVFVTLPGGFGTLDETFEVVTWKQIHTHNKPVYIYNQDGYWDKWIALTDHIIDNGFASAETRSYYEILDNMDELLAKFGK